MKVTVNRGVIKLSPENPLEAAELEDLYEGTVSVSAVHCGWPQAPGRFPFEIPLKSILEVSICYKTKEEKP